MKLLQLVVLVALASILVGSHGVRASAQEHYDDQGSEHEESGHEEHELHRHHVSIFLGATDGEVEVVADVGLESEGGAVIVESEWIFTLGLDYEYRLNQRWGIGGLVEYAGEDFRSWVYAVALVLHPIGGLKLYVGPGIEDKEGHEAEFLVRLGAMYGFEVGSFTLSPAINVDLVDDEEILVIGVNIGKGF